MMNLKGPLKKRLKQSLDKLKSLADLAITRLLQFVVSFYRVFLSGYTGGHCRFYPSCSIYSQEAFKMWPWPRAVLLTVKRLAKCHPLGPHGLDPVPEPRHKDVGVL